MWPTQRLPFCYWPTALVLTSMVQVWSFANVPARQLGLSTEDEGGEVLVRSVTSLFAHADVAHLATNLVSQLALGTFVEGLHGHWRFVLIYVLSGMGGALWFRAWWCQLDEGTAWLVGASTAVYGLMGSFGSHLLVNWAEMPLRWVWVACAALAVAADVALYLICPVPGVAYSSHVGGALFGVCWGVLLLRNVRVLRYEAVYYVAATLAALGLSMLVLLMC